MPLARAALLATCKALHINIEATLKKETYTNSELEELIQLNSEEPEKLVYENKSETNVLAEILEAQHTQQMAFAAQVQKAAATGNNTLLEQIFKMQQDSQSAFLQALATKNENAPHVKLRKSCETILASTEYGDKILKNPAEKFKHGASILQGYLLFSSIVYCLTQLAFSDKTFSVIDFIKGNWTDAKFTSNVWSAIDAVLHILVDQTLLTIGKPKCTLEQIHSMSQFSNKVQQLALLSELWKRAINQL